MNKKPEFVISSLTICPSDSRYLANILIQSGRMQCPTWRGLYKYWPYAKGGQVEYIATSYSGYYAVFSLSVASGQGGIIGVWNTCRRRWEHVSEANYVSCAMILEDIPAIISLHYMECWGVVGHHLLSATSLDRTLDGFVEISCPIKVLHSKEGFDQKSHKIQKAAFGDYVQNKYGPLGIFLLEDGKSVIAHDAGNLYQFSVEAVKEALKA